MKLGAQFVEESVLKNSFKIFYLLPYIKNLKILSFDFYNILLLLISFGKILGVSYFIQ